MLLSKNILILGGDLRQNRIHEILISKDYTCTYINDNSLSENANKKIPLYDVVILPVPVSHDGVYLYSNNKEVKIELDLIINSMTKAQLFIAGCISGELKAVLKEKSIEYFDFYESEELVLENAFLTAQGALRLLLENTTEYVKNKKMLITGYGRVAKATAAIMKDNGLDVYICVRSAAQKAEAHCLGYKTLFFDELDCVMHIFDFVINTVPCNIFSETLLSTLYKTAKYFELASVPYGIDKAKFEENPDIFIKGNALPGRFLPSAAGEIIEKIIEPILN